jgi:hypothetical protein
LKDPRTERTQRDLRTEAKEKKPEEKEEERKRKGRGKEDRKDEGQGQGKVGGSPLRPVEALLLKGRSVPTAKAVPRMWGEWRVQRSLLADQINL